MEYNWAALAQIVVELLGLFKRHQQGENVTKDLNELLDKVGELKAKEEAIANAPLPLLEEGPVGKSLSSKTTEELINEMKANDPVKDLEG